MWMRKLLIAVLLAYVTSDCSVAFKRQPEPRLQQALPSPSPQVGAGNLDTLRDQFRELHWIAYSPTNFNPNSEPPLVPSDASIAADLRRLRAYGFTGLITYGAQITSIPRLAAIAGFKSILIGVWDPRSRSELQQAKEVATQEIVVGLIVGNEGLSFSRYTLQELQRAMDDLRQETRKPVGTTEIYERYFSIPELISSSDFLTVNAHPFFHGQQMRDPQRAVEWTVAAYQELKKLSDKPLILKEVGLPSAGEPGLSAINQARYYELLLQSPALFCWFEAFDGPWKNGGAVEKYWGIFRHNRSPKLAARVAARAGLRQSPRSP
jgi:exo-beta-1,3-glucanase (GH17 family)